MSEGEAKSFWKSAGGILTGVAALITAVATLIGALGEPEEVDRDQETEDIAPSPQTTGAKWRDPVLQAVFSYVGPGNFQMGSPGSEKGRSDDETLHRVSLEKGFWISVTEITQSQFARFVTESGYTTSAERLGWSWVVSGNSFQQKEGATWSDSGGDDHPVAHVSWNDAQAFCDWLSNESKEVIRLPTEAEWEYAARAGARTATYAGDLVIHKDCEANVLEDISWYCGNSVGRSYPVATKEPNGWGLYDMLGGVWEWSLDVYAPYPGSSTKVLEAPRRVVRGGCWSCAAKDNRAAARRHASPDSHYSNRGFRLVRE